MEERIVDEFIPGFILSGIAIIVAILATEEPPEAVQQESGYAAVASGLRVEDADEVGAPGVD